jgi:hypothetical protein
LSGLFEVNVVADLILSLVCIAIIIDAIEIIFKRKQFSRGGVFDYAILKTYRKFTLNKIVDPTMSFLLDYPRFIYLIIFQVVVATILVSHLFASLSSTLNGPLIGIILLILLLLHFRNPYGGDGSDQMKVIVLVSLFIFYISPDLIVKQFAIFFICFQALLSYFTSGFAKLVSPVWRGGEAMRGIMNTMGYGNKVISRLLVKNAKLSKVICWSIIVFECIFPLLVFTGVNSAIIFIVIGIMFHLSIAIFMGLNNFFWSFVSTYPAILFFANNFQIFIIELKDNLYG